MAEPTPPKKWYESDLIKFGASIALSVLLAWLASKGIAPAPVPQQVPGVLVLTVGQPTPAVTTAGH